MLDVNNDAITEVCSVVRLAHELRRTHPLEEVRPLVDLKPLDQLVDKFDVIYGRVLQPHLSHFDCVNQSPPLLGSQQPLDVIRQELGDHDRCQALLEFGTRRCLIAAGRDGNSLQVLQSSELNHSGGICRRSDHHSLGFDGQGGVEQPPTLIVAEEAAVQTLVIVTAE